MSECCSTFKCLNTPKASQDYIIFRFYEIHSDLDQGSQIWHSEMPLVEQIRGANHSSNRILTLPRMFDGEVFPPFWIVWDYYELAQGFTPHLYPPHSISAMIKTIHGHGTHPSFVLREFLSDRGNPFFSCYAARRHLHWCLPPVSWVSSQDVNLKIKALNPPSPLKLMKRKRGESLLVRNGYCTEAIRKNEDWQFNFAKYYKRKDVSWDGF